MKIIQLDISELSHLEWFQSERLTQPQLEGINQYLAEKQTNKQLKLEQQQRALDLAQAKRIKTLNLITEYVRTSNIFDERGIGYPKIRDIANNINRTEKTIRNVLTSYATENSIPVDGKFKKMLPELLKSLL